MISVELKLLDKTDIKELMEMKANCGGTSLSEPKPKTGIVTHCKEYSNTNWQTTLHTSRGQYFVYVTCLYALLGL